MISPFVVVCVVGLAVSLVGEGTDRFALRAIGKAAASFAFVGYALQLGVPELQPHGPAVLAALILSVVGDLLLLGTARKVFLAGLGAFLLAHVAYVVAFLTLAPSPWGAAATGAPLLAGAWLVWRWLGPHVGRMRVPVLVYISVIVAMVTLAGAVAATGRPGTAWLLVAAVLFFVSDLFVARQRFVSPEPANRYVGLPLYYAAQLLFAWAAVGVGR